MSLPKETLVRLCSKSEGGMSASGYKQTFRQVCQNVGFTPKSGHSEAQERVGLKKQTLDVRFTPKSGRKWLRHLNADIGQRRRDEAHKASRGWVRRGAGHNFKTHKPLNMDRNRRKMTSTA